ncbi:MAG: hypothetical protein JW821_08975 [Deltaproteobacteria bacterium]|nr:hypothetical protein [Deltaproteobacteria bacterium]
MESQHTDFERTLLLKLEGKGVASRVVPRFIKDVVNLLFPNPSMDFRELNPLLHRLGWEDVDLDYRTLELVKACYEEGRLRGNGVGS